MANKGLGIFLLSSPNPCPSAHQIVGQHSKLLSLLQRWASIKGFTYQFLFVEEGLNISNAMLKDIFNNSLNEPVSAWEMGMLSFWQFVGNVYHCGEEGCLPTLGPPVLPLRNFQIPKSLMTTSRRGGTGPPHLLAVQRWLSLLQSSPWWL
ncbi:hypothetical protein PO909_012984 [Leuciscus waleckii]